MSKETRRSRSLGNSDLWRIDLFQGEKHHGYHVLYENLKHEEDSVQELAQFLKERASFEEETTKFYSKCIARVRARWKIFRP